MSNMDTAGGSPGFDGQDTNQTAGKAAGSAKEMASAAAQTIKQEAASFAETAKEKAIDQVEQHKATATDALGDFANAIRTAGDQLSQNQSLAGRVVKQAADGLEGLSRSVSQKRPEELLDAVRAFGRENPAAFLAGSVLVGLAIGRFARSSEHHAQQGGSRQIASQDFGQSASYGYGGQSQDAGLAGEDLSFAESSQPVVGGEPTFGADLANSRFNSAE